MIGYGLNINKMSAKILRIPIIVIIFVGTFALACAQDAVNSKEEQVDAALAAQEKDENKALPLSATIINGDVIEYLPENNEASATGNVVIVYGGSKLTCDKVVVNNLTKEARAEGNARLEDAKGVITGDTIVYNFQTKSGVIMDPGFRANPYFGKGKKAEKASEGEFIVNRGYITTCNLDHPHYRFMSRRISVFPQNKIQTKDDIFYLGNTPIFYIPQYNHSLREPFMHVQLMPGKSGEWGQYMLSAWRLDLSDNIKGKVYLDYRKKLGWAEGLGANYKTQGAGKGDFKFYYTKEDAANSSSSSGGFQRYLLRLRHRWNIDSRTNVVSELYRIHDQRRKLEDPDRNMLKDYFYREFEKDDQPLSYFLFHHNLQNSSFDLLFQKRVNHWYDQVEKLPQAQYSLPDLQIANTPFYLDSFSSIATYNKKAVTSPVTAYDVKMTRLDSINTISLPAKVAFMSFTPFVGHRETVYDKGSDGKSLPMRSTFYTGADLSTKFYRTLDVSSGALGMDINGLRHVITPSIGYAYNHEPNIDKSNLYQVDAIDAITKSNVVTFELSNKLQTKRKGKNVDLADLRINTSYLFDPPDDAVKSGSSLSDFLFKLKLLPYSWLRIEGDATFNRSVATSDPDYNHFTQADYDINFDFDKDRSIGFGQRYQKNDGNEVTANLRWRLNPKWKFSTYQRYNISAGLGTSKGLSEQEYTLSRDLHCWIMDITLNNKKDDGTSLWFIFRLKAFPEMEFGLNQSYNSPQSGASSNPKE